MSPPHFFSHQPSKVSLCVELTKNQSFLSLSTKNDPPPSQPQSKKNAIPDGIFIYTAHFSIPEKNMWSKIVLKHQIKWQFDLHAVLFFTANQNQQVHGSQEVKKEKECGLDFMSRSDYD